MSTFQDLSLCKPLLRAIADKGYTTPTPIQAKAIPAILSGRDVLAAAQTGTGKTAGFTLPVLEKLMHSAHGANHRLRVLVLTPTRELAAQVAQSVEDYGKHLSFRQTVVFGGVNIRPQAQVLQAGVDILIATPGRLIDLCQQRMCQLHEVDTLILDEADRMLDMGFIPDMRRIVKMIPKRRQTLLFSATFSKEIRGISREFLFNPMTIEVAPENTAAETVAQRAYRCDANNKAQLLTDLIKRNSWEQVLVFTRTKHGANRLSRHLHNAGVKSDAIHGDKAQNARTRALENFKKNKTQVLVATDIAARGLDISELPHVVNYELPNIPEDYVHRIGRTGRAGKDGEAISLVCNEERPYFKSIQKLINQTIPLDDLKGHEPGYWPDTPPTAKEVQKAVADRRKAALATRRPRASRQGGDASNQRRNSSSAKKNSRPQKAGMSHNSRSKKRR